MAGQLSVQQQVPPNQFVLLGIETQSQLMLVAPLTMVYPDGASDTLPAHTAAAVYGGGSTFDRTGAMWVAYTVKGSGVLSVIQEASLMTVVGASTVAVLARVAVQGVLSWQVL